MAQMIRHSLGVIAGQQNSVPSNHMDAAIIVPHFTSTLLPELDDEINCSHPTDYKTFCAESGGWLMYKFFMNKIKNSGLRDNRQTDATVLRDKSRTDATGHAAFEAFQQVIEQSQQPSGGQGYFSAKEPVKSLCKRVLALFDLFCKDLSVENSCDAACLKDNIIEAADSAEEYINWERRQTQFPEDMDYDELILEDLRDSLIVKYVHQDTFSNMQYATESLNDHLVGIGRDLITIKERLMGTMSELEIIPIVGMGGIGKTTLARNVYEDPQVMFHFHVRAWVRVSQEYCERDVLLGLLESIDPLSKEVYKEEKEQLAERLYRRLKGRRYFIVVDDIWTPKAWDEMKLCFPNDGNGSRIILTSRVSQVASHVNPDNSPHFMNLLCLEDSWDLLHKQVFGKKASPPQLVEVGRKIAKKCQGLPLAIKVVAGYLSKTNMNLDCWKVVAEEVGLATETQFESLFKILSISYNDLPQPLKACFMSLVIFPKNYEIPVGKLIRLWIAMGFLRSESSSNLEKAAMKCFKDLISRSLIMVRKRKFDGEVKSCSIHDLLWDLCMREAWKEGGCIFGNFSLNHSFFDTSDDTKYVMGLSRSLLYFGHSMESECPLNSSEFKLLKVLDILNQSFDHFPDEITNLVNLRYLSIATGSIIPAVSKLSNLETLMNNHESGSGNLPKEIWLLERLRYLHVGTCTNFPDPVSVLPDLRELSTISSGSCTKEVLLNFPKLIALRIHHHVVLEGENMADVLLFNCLSNLVYLQQLEKLTLWCTGGHKSPSCNISEWDSFLPHIKHLSLIGTCLPWKEMNALTRLPNLEVLKLKQNSFIGSEWEMDEAFLELKCLLLQSLDLEIWNANQDHFPNLQCLVIQNCEKLMAIPTDFGEISTLNLIDMEGCSYVAVLSSGDIMAEQWDNGNDKFTVRIGRMAPARQIKSFFKTFVYVTMRFKMLQAKQDLISRMATAADTLRWAVLNFTGDALRKIWVHCSKIAREILNFFKIVIF